MIFEFKQINKELYSAQFELIEDNGRKIGEAALTGGVTKIDGDWLLTFPGHSIELKRISEKEANPWLGSYKRDKPFRPYRVSRVFYQIKPGDYPGLPYFSLMVSSFYCCDDSCDDPCAG